MAFLRAASRSTIALIASTLIACADSSTAPRGIGSIALSPGTPSLASGEQLTLVASVLDDRGRLLSGRALAWASSDSQVAGVSSTGVVTAGQNRNGSAAIAVITATSEGKSGSATVSVRPVAVARVVVAPDSVTLLPGATTALSATSEDATGMPLSDRATTWLARDTLVARVSAAGLVTAASYFGASTRSTWVKVTSEGRVDSIPVVIIPHPVSEVGIQPGPTALRVGSTRQMVAEAKDATGNILLGRSVQWSSSDSSTVSVSAAGLITAAMPGFATIRAYTQGTEDSITIRVYPAFSSYLELDGVDDQILGNTKGLYGPSSHFAIEMWVRTNDTTESTGNFFASNATEAWGDISFGYRNGRLFASFTDNVGPPNRVESSTTIDLTEWSHIAWAKEGSVQRLFVNGLMVASATSDRLFARWDQAQLPPYFSIGGYRSASNQPGFLRFDVARVRITSGYRYSANFVPTDIWADGPSAVVVYRLNGDLVDSAPDGRAGTLMGGTWRP